jgi:hypothetical protein
MSKVSSGNKPDKKLYKLVGIIKEGENICLISTCADMNFKTAVSAPPIKSKTIKDAHKNELLIIYNVLVSI